jgi:hypothetical protein
MFRISLSFTNAFEKFRLSRCNSPAGIGMSAATTTTDTIRLPRLGYSVRAREQRVRSSALHAESASMCRRLLAVRVRSRVPTGEGDVVWRGRLVGSGPSLTWAFRRPSVRRSRGGTGS